MTGGSRTRAGRTGNRLLDGLRPADFKLLAGALETVRLSSRHILHRTEDAVDHLYFPITAVLTSTVRPASENGPGVEITTVGNEGMAEITTLFGVAASLLQTACQVPGDCFRLPVAVLAQAMVDRPSVDALVKRYMAVSFGTAAQAVVCQTLHPVEQRLCRWLVVVHEKAAGDFPATHEFLAAVLGVKRPTISVVATTLQKAGFIDYHRGTIRILNREGLEGLACDCYRVTKELYERTIRR